MHTKLRVVSGLLGSLAGLVFPIAVLAQSAFDGGGTEEGLLYASGIVGIGQGSIRETILRILYVVLSYLALLAVIIIVAAGIYLVLSFGSEEVKERVKRVLIYTVVGLVIVALARLFVGFVLYTLYQAA